MPDQPQQSAHDRLGAEIVKSLRAECAACEQAIRALEETVLRRFGWTVGAPEAHWLLSHHDGHPHEEVNL